MPNGPAIRAMANCPPGGRPGGRQTLPAFDVLPGSQPHSLSPRQIGPVQVPRFGTAFFCPHLLGAILNINLTYICVTSLNDMTTGCVHGRVRQIILLLDWAVAAQCPTVLAFWGMAQGITM